MGVDAESDERVDDAKESVTLVGRVDSLGLVASKIQPEV
jgi:hypothetical protein